MRQVLLPCAKRPFGTGDAMSDVYKRFTDLIDRFNAFLSIDEQIEYLERITQSAHDASQHSYTLDEKKPGVCCYCDWIHPDTESGCACGKTLFEHAIRMLEITRSYRGRYVRIQFASSDHLPGMIPFTINPN